MLRARTTIERRPFLTPSEWNTFRGTSEVSKNFFWFNTSKVTTKFIKFSDSLPFELYSIQALIYSNRHSSGWCHYKWPITVAYSNNHSIDFPFFSAIHLAHSAFPPHHLVRILIGPLRIKYSFTQGSNSHFVISLLYFLGSIHATPKAPFIPLSTAIPSVLFTSKSNIALWIYNFQMYIF